VRWAGAVRRLRSDNPLPAVGGVRFRRFGKRDVTALQIGHFAPGNLIPRRTSRSPVIPNQ
jgi:hypothetical protein